MNIRKTAVTVAVLAVLAAGGWGLYALGMHQGMGMMGADAMSMSATPAKDKKVLYWHDPMVPGQRFDKPGPSPFMDMQLVPVYADEGADGAAEGGVSISPQVQQNLGIRTAEVRLGTLQSQLSAVGSVAWNERDVAVLQARAAGFVERLLVRAPLDAVRQGQVLAELYVPDWVAAQEEFLSLRQLFGEGTAALRDGARQRMRLVGMTPAQIALVERTGKTQPRLAITAPISGVISELAIREGMTVMPGSLLFRINGLSRVWVNAEVPEAMAAQVRPGTTVEAEATAFPGKVFTGRVSAILPDVDATTRTLKARVELANPQAELVPGMFATLHFTSPARAQVLLVPSEAVIRTGTRSVVFVRQASGNLQSVNVETGSDSQGQTEIRSGLVAGQKVVVSGQFLVDSEASLKGVGDRMNAVPEAPAGMVDKMDMRGMSQ
ncbi:MAG: efflux RND transporter periplasmic adaptor subunit [Pseudomonadota bacterium]